MKFMKKVVFVLVVSLGFNVVSVFANINVITSETKEDKTLLDDKGVKTLTLESAVQRALGYNQTVKKLDISLENTKENIKILNSKLFDSFYLSTDLALQSQIKQAENSQAILEKEVKEQDIIVRKSVEDSFVAIVKAEQSYLSYKKGLPIVEEDFKIAKVKRSLNLLSEKDFETAKTTYNNKIKEDDTLNADIKESYRKLNELMGAASQTVYNIDYEVTYKKMPILSVEALTSNVFKADTMSINKKNSIDLKTEELKTYFDRNVDNATGQLKEDITSKEYSEREIWQLQIELNDREQAIRKSVITLNDAILKQELAYDTKVSELKDAKEQLKTKKIQYEVGKLTKLDIDKAEYNIYTLEQSIYFLTLEHHINIMKIQNIPLVLSY